MIATPASPRAASPASFLGRTLGLLLLPALLGVTGVVRAEGFDPAALPAYHPAQQVAGVIRNYGNGYAGLLQRWEDAFRRLQPGVTFQDTLPTSDAAFAGLITGLGDLAPDGGEPAITETLAFFEVYGYHATSITVASGTFDADGRSPGVVVFVNQANPIDRLTLPQLDGIFGAERNGGLHGFEWSPVDARGPDKDIRTWGQLGLTGDWAHRPIQTYGHAPSGASRFFELHVLASSDKWNPNYRGYVESGSKMIAAVDRQTQHLGIRHMLTEELARDESGIAWTIMPQAKGIGGIKPVALSAGPGQPFVFPSQATFQDRTYPLVRSIYIYLNRKPGTPVEPRLRQFLQFILSREGQAIVADGSGFLPLPAAAVADQRAKLD
ncbi:MAG: PstS family phosphate ABC transporter substrate-binding protein [Opitutales bacterium]